MNVFKRIVHGKNQPPMNENVTSHHATPSGKSYSLQFDVQAHTQLASKDSFVKKDKTIALNPDEIIGTIPAYLLEVLAGTFGISQIDIIDIIWGKPDPAKRTLAFSQALWSQVERFAPDCQYVNEDGKTEDNNGNPVEVTFYRQFFDIRSIDKEPLYIPIDPQIITSYTSPKQGEPRTGEWKYEQNFKLGEYYRTLLPNPIADALKAYAQVIANPGDIEHEWFFDLLPSFMEQLGDVRDELIRLYDDISFGRITNGSTATIKFNCKFIEKVNHPQPTTNSPIPRLNPANFDLDYDTYNLTVDEKTPRWVLAAIADLRLSMWHIERIRMMKIETPQPPSRFNFWPF